MQEKQTYQLYGLDCSHCALKLEKKINDLPEVQKAAVNFGTSTLTIWGKTPLDEIEKISAAEGVKLQQAPSKTDSTELARLIVAAIGMIIGLKFPYAFLFSIVIGGYPLFIKGIKKIIAANFDMNALMTIAVVGACAINEWGEAALIVFLFALSEKLESHTVYKARKSVKELLDIAPKTAIVLRDGKEIELSVEKIKKDDLLIVKPGEKFAMDGIIQEGYSTIDQSAITGESLPVEKVAGDHVYAGTLNYEGVLKILVTGSVNENTMQKIVEMINQAQAKRTSTQGMIERFAKIYTPVVLIAALLTFVIPLVFGLSNMTEWLYRSLAILMIGCPCSLILSTPITIISAITRAAKHGILIKNAKALENVGNITGLAFDKTGTLTTGEMVVQHSYVFGEISLQKCIQIAASIERYANHPLSHAILNLAEEKNVPLLEQEDFKMIAGKGVSAVIDTEKYYLGNTKIFQENFPTLFTSSLQQTLRTFQESGYALVLLGTSQEILAAFLIRDQIRESAKEALQDLNDMGINKLVMLTGDLTKSAHGVAEEVGIKEVYAEILPEEKLEKIKEIQQTHGPIGMVGDGINDSPSLASASVGIAIGIRGTDMALEAAEVVLMSKDLNKIPYLVRLGQSTSHIIRQNLVLSIGLKVLAGIFMLANLLSLWMAVIADVGTTLLIVFNSLRILNKK